MNRAFITGASSGIGQSVTQLLSEHEWEIIAPTHAELDLGDLHAVTLYAEQLKTKGEQFDAFIHLAGIWHDAQVVLADKPLSGFMS